VTLQTADVLLRAGIRPSAQRVAIAQVVLESKAHPSADQVLAAVQAKLPQVSRATVYNTLNLLVKKGLLRAFSLSAGHVVFDPKIEPHHHFVDESNGEIHDIPWAALVVEQVDALRGFDIAEYQVVLRGQLRKSTKPIAARQKPQRLLMK
jgi:Fur family transcriptional regulator, iron response regulator